MREVIAALNRLVERNVIPTYAIGGATAAAQYLEAVNTEDIDAFIFLPPTQSGFITLTPIYTALAEEGGTVEREYVRFGQDILQVLPDVSDLVSEAIREATVRDYEGTTARVMRPEHLCAISLETGRGKDYIRVMEFLNQRKVNLAALTNLVDRYGLRDKLKKAEDLSHGDR